MVISAMPPRAKLPPFCTREKCSGGRVNPTSWNWRDTWLLVPFGDLVDEELGDEGSDEILNWRLKWAMALRTLGTCMKLSAETVYGILEPTTSMIPRSICEHRRMISWSPSTSNCTSAVSWVSGHRIAWRSIEEKWDRIFFSTSTRNFSSAKIPNETEVGFAKKIEGMSNSSASGGNVRIDRKGSIFPYPLFTTKIPRGLLESRERLLWYILNCDSVTMPRADPPLRMNVRSPERKPEMKDGSLASTSTRKSRRLTLVPDSSGVCLGRTSLLKEVC